jgi:hypothetical protein
MTAVLSSASLIIRLLVVAAMVIASLGVLPAAVAGPREDPAHHVQAASVHDCCEPEHAPPDRSCGLTCAQASCGWTVPSAAAGWPEPMDRRADHWPALAALPEDIAPETATPPPRA